jgi:hypothetical protein
MFYSTAARTMKEAEERNNFYDGGMPYINARSSVHGGYKSATWRNDEKIVAFCAVAAFVALGALLAVAYHG